VCRRFALVSLVEYLKNDVIHLTPFIFGKAYSIKASNKHVLMASLVYNLQKYLRFIVKKPDILAQAIAFPEGEIYASLKSVSVFINNSILSVSNLRTLCKN